MSARRAVTLAVASGKGGVGKTSVAVNLAVALTRLQRRVVLIDADFGLGNVDVFLGLTPQRHIGHLLSGDATLDQIAMGGPSGLRIIPASSGLRSLTSLSSEQRRTLADAFETLTTQYDVVIIDTASGISDNVVDVMTLAGRVMLVTSVEPSAIVDAYATAKVLTSAAPHIGIGVVVNSARSDEDAGLAFRQLDVAARRFLGRGLEYYGFVVDDAAVRDAALVQRSIIDHLPQAPASRCFRLLAGRMAALEGTAVGHLRLVATATTDERNAEVPQCA